MNVGLVGLDNSHVIAFTKLLNDPQDPYYMGPQARMAMGFPGLPSDFHWSHTRVDKFTAQLRDELHLEIANSAEEVARRCDLVLMTAVDARQHRRLFESILAFKKPVFIDKPLTTSLADARAILDQAHKAGVAVMCSSALRYADNFRAALAGKPLLGIDVYGPMAEEPALPGLFWYGVHSVEMAVAAMGAGCRKLRAVYDAPSTLVCLHYDNGRTALIRGLEQGHGGFGATLHRKDSVTQVNVNDNKRPYYAGEMEVILAELAHGRMPVPAEQMLEVVAIMEAANRSRSSGQEVTL